MKTLILIYLVSAIISWISIRGHERRLSARKGVLWPITIVPGFNTVITIWYLLEIIEKGSARIRKIFNHKG
jgi:hypothetical protein